MIDYTEFTLPNGLKVIVNQDNDSQIVAMNLLYGVGSRDEDPGRTGFAHLFEHLMFGGTDHVTDYDLPVQIAGGENNAFTNSDYTNYYLTLPWQNIETGFWLESDRMVNLNITQERLDIQKNVVSEEFKQRYLNQPYGDVWLKLRPLAYQNHPYRWPTIGSSIEHIMQSSLEDVIQFYRNFYQPNNAILSLAGNIDPEKAEDLSNKWFGDIPSTEVQRIKYKREAPQVDFRELEVKGPVPQMAVYLAYHISDRLSEDYYVADVVSDILGSGNSARLHNELVKGKAIFSEVDAYLSGERDPGLFVIHGTLRDGVDETHGLEAIEEELEKLISKKLADRELTKVKNKIEANMLFSHVSTLSKAMNLSYFSWLNHPEWIRNEMEIYEAISPGMVQQFAAQTFQRNKCSFMVYKPIDE